jgi:hypothetical protein
VRRLLGILAAVVVVAVATPDPARAASAVPYNDSQSIGFITLYDKAGKAVKGGTLTDKPFVWKAVSSQKAPAPYDGDGRKASLLAYQPRKGAPPTDWSGDTLTAATAYPDAGHPTAQAGAEDFSLQDFLVGLPPRWDGLIQLRMYFAAPGQAVLTGKYASTDIRVTGQTWAIAGGGPGAGAGGANIPGVPGPGAKGGGAGGAAAGDSAGGGGGLLDGTPVGNLLPGLGSNGTLVVAAVVIVALVLAGVFWRRRRQGGEEGESPPA